MIATQTLILSSLRILLHSTVILWGFFCMIKLRSMTDLIPWVQLRVPMINTTETMIYACIAVWLFVILWFHWKLYKIHQPPQNYTKHFFYTYLLRGAIMTVIAYYGYGFVFSDGISRLVIIWSMARTLIRMAIVDGIINNLLYAYFYTKPIQIGVIYQYKKDYDTLLDQFSTEQLYELHGHEYDEVWEQRNHWLWLLSDYDRVVMLGNYDLQQLQYIADYCAIHTKTMYHLSDSFLLEDLIYKIEPLGPLMVFEYNWSNITDRWVMIKRACDIVWSIIGIIVLFPILLILAILVKYDSSGPILYISHRVGRGGKLFDVWKFRTMYTEYCVWDEYGGTKATEYYQQLIQTHNIRDDILPKIQNDPRITRVGKRLRKLSLDELPQLRNVFVGDMSLIGPRPHMPNEVDQYQRWHRRLLAIKPGITGYSQIYGRDKLTLDEEARLDLYYIQNRSLFLDATIILATLQVLNKGK